jgi:hypothetical protein
MAFHIKLGGLNKGKASRSATQAEAGSWALNESGRH